MDAEAQGPAASTLRLQLREEGMLEELVASVAITCAASLKHPGSHSMMKPEASTRTWYKHWGSSASLTATYLISEVRHETVTSPPASSGAPNAVSRPVAS
ncbi:hypothetical protein Q8A67_025306 [Cirrhinus molitorella]|uniref:Uncharacterized protein n=1 Tax=Cirrhinus molitorella TaxID=172907 RepID=A0AA88NZT2_9TELE|nr:hypothetical protein Q8A67_025306 [Cirrhinus molitorella]